MEVIQPARLSFLSLYNPSLGRTDETLHDQVLYYYSAHAHRTKKSSGRSTEEIEDANREERNERLRQIGLAQGIVEFAKAFSDGEPVDAIDSEKSRVVLHELEPGWWILASVELTRIRNKPSHSRTKSESAEDLQSEYSAREIAPQGLLLQNLLRAHDIFLLHHASSLSDLHLKLSRTKFCAVIERYWNKFVRDWDVFLNGNPAVDMYHGIKLAAGGELGIGVGEEEWGSGEREVLEGFIGRTDGLVDMVVSRFGDVPEYEADATPNKKTAPWLGLGSQPSSTDGVIFSGVSAITRSSVRSISAWLELIYRSGIAAYGVADNPQATRRKRRLRAEASDRATGSGPTTPTRASHHRGRSSGTATLRQQQKEAEHPSIPPPIVRAANSSLEVATANLDKKDAASGEQEGTDVVARATGAAAEQPASPGSASKQAQGFDSETLLKYMTLGVYGSSWGIPSRNRSPSSSRATPPRSRSATGTRGFQKQPADEDDAPFPPKPLRLLAPKPATEPGDASRALDVENGCFLIGLRGDLNLEDDAPEEEEPGTTSNTDHEAPMSPAKPAQESSNWNRRIMVRSLYVQRHRTSSERPEASEPRALTFFDRHRVVVYARRPFLFAFVFDAQTPTLSYTGLYRALHHQLGPLKKPLLLSTTPANAAVRLSDALRSARSGTTQAPTPDSEHPIYALLYDPSNLTVLASLPNIPEPGTPAAEGFFSKGGSPSRTGVLNVSAWTRADALSTHAHILSVIAATRGRNAEVERLAQTSRGWWVVWLRLLAQDKQNETNASEQSKAQERAAAREAFLVRKALDQGGPQAAKKGFGFGSPSKGSGAREGMGRIVEGIGVDARKYIDGLLSLNR